SIIIYLLLTQIRRHHRYTLFPYTTLFRSSQPRPEPEARHPAPSGVEQEVQHVAVLDLVGLALDAELAGFLGAGLALAGDVILVGDRKSTRLNSSHVKISYAVFCLKKKKKM